jgi:hypothetical protein
MNEPKKNKFGGKQPNSPWNNGPHCNTKRAKESYENIHGKKNAQS